MKALVALAFVSACASSVARDDPSPDAGGGSSSPPGTMTCGANQHSCGADCVANRANTPDVGCSLGCGGACPTPENGTASCSASGLCEVTCMPGYAHVGDHCVVLICEHLG